METNKNVINVGDEYSVRGYMIYIEAINGNRTRLAYTSTGIDGAVTMTTTMTNMERIIRDCTRKITLINR